MTLKRLDQQESLSVEELLLELERLNQVDAEALNSKVYNKDVERMFGNEERVVFRTMDYPMVSADTLTMKLNGNDDRPFPSAYVLPCPRDMIPTPFSPKEKLETYAKDINETYDALYEQLGVKDQLWPHRGRSREYKSFAMSQPTEDFLPFHEDFILNPFHLTYQEQSIRIENGASLLRKPGDPQDYTRGSIGSLPFRPGGTSSNHETLETHARSQDTRRFENPWDTEEELQRSMIVLQEKILDQDDLDKILMAAPGITGHLSKEDVLLCSKEDDESIEMSKSAVDEAKEKSQNIIQNYSDQAQDHEYVRSLKSSNASQKIYASSQGEKSTALTLHDLLTESEEDDLNLYADDDVENNNNDEPILPIEIADPSKEILPNSSASMASHLSPSQLKSSFETLVGKAGQDNECSSLDVADELLSLDFILESNHPLSTHLPGESTKRMPKGSSSSSNSSMFTSQWNIFDRIDNDAFHAAIPNMAMTYPFELDDFQKAAIMHIENQECVFVAAHTSAGKTVVAEYAFALAKRHMTRAIYTSPIKALSNQKFRDFRTKFGKDVGIITGDVSIDADASCLIMTTEILRSMLYRGADLIRDVEWVIFDEIHYINDTDRGVVWEEVIIMLPDHVNMIFLSATTPNTFEFSDWIGRTKQKKIHVLSTTKRPIPLQHFLYTQGELFRVMDAQGNFSNAAYTQAKNKIENKSDLGNNPKSKSKSSSSTSTTTTKNSSVGDKSQWTKLVRLLEQQNLLPVIVFAFSKRTCEESSNRLTSLDLTTSSEKSDIHVFLENSLSRLQGSDKKLPQVLNLKALLLRGIGVHHGGLLPILKEVVEILFSRGLVKLLFATETFAMGVNMPARTVIFHGLRKHDGNTFRDLLSGEYTQMAGRAGRRGLDQVGTVLVTCFNEIVADLSTLRGIMVGAPTRLESQFRLTYTMILTLFRVEDMTVEDMMKRSFSEFRTRKLLDAKNLPQAMERAATLLLRLEGQVESCIKGGETAIDAFHGLNEQEERATKFIHEKVFASRLKEALCTGRVVYLDGKGLRSAISLVLKVTSDKGSMDHHLVSQQADLSGYQVACLVMCPEEYEPSTSAATKSNASTTTSTRRVISVDRFPTKVESSQAVAFGVKGFCMGKAYVFLNVPLHSISWICKATTKLDVSALLNGSTQDLTKGVEYLTSLSELYPMPSRAPHLDPRKDLKLNSMDIVEAIQDWESVRGKMKESKCYDCPQFDSMFKRTDQIIRLQRFLSRTKNALSSNNLSLFPDFQQRIQVLKHLGYIDEVDQTVQLKGRVACEINTCEELLLTEIIFQNVLTDLEPEEIVALLAALIFQERSVQDVELNLTHRLFEAKETMVRITKALGLIQLEHGLDANLHEPREYTKQCLNFGLTEVVYEWARGMAFLDICHLTLVQEGSIVRCITRLDDVCREVRNISRIIGDARLFRKMEMASESIKRDVVFATSLYFA